MVLEHGHAHCYSYRFMQVLSTRSLCRCATSRTLSRSAWRVWQPARGRTARTPKMPSVRRMARHAATRAAAACLRAALEHAWRRSGSARAALCWSASPRSRARAACCCRHSPTSCRIWPPTATLLRGSAISLSLGLPACSVLLDRPFRRKLYQSSPVMVMLKGLALTNQPHRSSLFAFFRRPGCSAVSFSLLPVSPTPGTQGMVLKGPPQKLPPLSLMRRRRRCTSCAHSTVTAPVSACC